jgi:hypothetical protein
MYFCGICVNMLRKANLKSAKVILLFVIMFSGFGSISFTYHFAHRAYGQEECAWYESCDTAQPEAPVEEVPDTGTYDAGSTDTGTYDAGSTDTGTYDAGSTDTGTYDAGSTDSGNEASSYCYPSSEACSALSILLSDDGSVLCDPAQYDCSQYLNPPLQETANQDNVNGGAATEFDWLTGGDANVPVIDKTDPPGQYCNPVVEACDAATISPGGCFTDITSHNSVCDFSSGLSPSGGLSADLSSGKNFEVFCNEIITINCKEQILSKDNSGVTDPGTSGGNTNCKQVEDPSNARVVCPNDSGGLDTCVPNGIYGEYCTPLEEYCKEAPNLSKGESKDIGYLCTIAFTDCPNTGGMDKPVISRGCAVLKDMCKDIYKPGLPAACEYYFPGEKYDPRSLKCGPNGTYKDIGSQAEPPNAEFDVCLYNPADAPKGIEGRERGCNTVTEGEEAGKIVCQLPTKK